MRRSSTFDDPALDAGACRRFLGANARAVFGL
jgi:hypothetical protein